MFWVDLVITVACNFRNSTVAEEIPIKKIHTADNKNAPGVYF